jgi:hypothetical protein
MNHRKFYLTSLVALFATFAHAEDKPVAPSDQRTFLSQYESVRAALASDDLSAAKQAATTITAASNSTNAKTLAAAETLPAAREAFKGLSQEALKASAGQPGYYHAHCPMVPNDEGDWVQTSKKISNPYFGKKMATCGSIEN